MAIQRVGVKRTNRHANIYLQTNDKMENKSKADGYKTKKNKLQKGIPADLEVDSEGESSVK